MNTHLVAGIRVRAAGQLSSGRNIFRITPGITARDVWSISVILLLRVRLALTGSTHPSSESGKPRGGHKGQQSLLLAGSGHGFQLNRCMQHGGDLSKSKSEERNEEQTHLNSRVKEGLCVPLCAVIIILERVEVKIGSNKRFTGLTISCESSRGSSFTSST